LTATLQHSKRSQSVEYIDGQPEIRTAANIAEGNGRFTIRDRKNFFGIARESVQERVALLELAKRRGLVQPEDRAIFKVDLEEIARLRSGIINTPDKRNA